LARKTAPFWSIFTFYRTNKEQLNRIVRLHAVIGLNDGLLSRIDSAILNAGIPVYREIKPNVTLIAGATS